MEDTVRVRIDFMTDESGKFAKTILETQKFNKEIKEAQKEVNQLEKDIEAMDKKDLSTVGTKQKLAEAQKKLTEAINGSLTAGKSLAALDLKNVAPSQLQERLRQVNQQLKQIPENLRHSHPEAHALKNEADAISKALSSVTAKAKDVSSAMTQIQPSVSPLSSIFQTAFGIFLGGGLLGIVQQIVGGLKSLFTASLEASGQFENANISFEVMLGSAVKAKKLIAELQKLAASTPFETDELIDYAKRLLAMGISAESIVPTMTALGNIAAGVGKEKLPQLVLAFGQVQTKTKLAGGELKQFTEAGVPLVAALAAQFNKTEAEIFKMSEAGKIGFKDVEKAIFAMSAAGGKFENLMARQSLTLSGLWSTFKDNITLNVLIPLGNAIGSFLKPLVSGFNDFFGQLTAYFREGKKPVGDFADAIELTGRVLRILGNALVIVWEATKPVLNFFWEAIQGAFWLGNRLGDLVNWFIDLATEAKKITLITTFFKPILDIIGLLSDLLSDASATFAGFSAAAQQAVINVQAYFKALVIDAEILGAKISGALSFDASIKAAAAKNVTALQAQKTAMFNAGKTIEQAYTEGRNAAMAVQAKVEAEAETKKQNAKKLAEDIDEKAAKKAAKDRLKALKDAQELEIKEIENYWGRELLANEIAHFKKERTNSEFAEQEAILSIEKYDALIKIQKNYLSIYTKNSEEYFDTEKKIFEFEKKRATAAAVIAPRNTQEVETLKARKPTSVEHGVTATNLDVLKSEEEIKYRILQAAFARQLLNEINFENEKARIRKEFAERAYNEAYKNGEVEKGQLEKLYKEKVDSDNHYQATIRDNEKRTADLKHELEQVKLGLASQAFGVAIELLSKDEAARKKNAGAIKAFQIGQITVDGVAEVSSIWKNANANPINALIPGAGNVIAAVQTALAVGRTISGIAKVNSSKFAFGGLVKSLVKNGIFGGRPHSAGGTKGYFEDGTAIEVERGEAFAVVNKKNTPLLKALSFVNSYGGNGIPFFADGGVMNLNTSPIGFNSSLNTPSVSINFDTASLESKIDKLTNVVANQQTQLKAYVALDDFEARQDSVNKDRSNAAF
jgi:tape measure domain-containing protein